MNHLMQRAHQSRRMRRAASALLFLGLGAAAASAPARLIVTEAGEASTSGAIEIRGVAAGAFEPRHWEANRLHWVPDTRSPLILPREGNWRNIYAPSAVEVPGGWRIFYGGWDGAPTGNDRIYSTTTADFLGFAPPRTVIEHGGFQHVCNVNALAKGNGGFEMVCTVYPDGAGLNKPALFRSPDGEVWNGSPGIHTAGLQDIVRMTGYDRYAGADINGMNVLLREGDSLRLYFGNFRDFGKVYRATASGDGTAFTLDGTALRERLAVNDVKKFRTAQGDWYLMGLHMNRAELRYALSRDGLRFDESKRLFKCLGDEDHHMVALGWVVAGEQEKEGRRLLGVLYGAGDVPSLDRNRIFARWLQKRVALALPQGRELEGRFAFGPDRQLIAMDRERDGGPVSEPVRVRLFAEDGTTLLAESEPLRLVPGQAYEVSVEDEKSIAPPGSAGVSPANSPAGTKAQDAASSPSEGNQRAGRSRSRGEDPSLGAKPCAIEDLKRPYVLLTADRLEELRREITSPGRKQDYYRQAIRKNADRWLARAITIPERAGHYHHFVCDDGTRLRVPEDQQFDTTGTYVCPVCGRSYSGDRYDGGRRNYEHLWLMTAARDLALSGALEGERRYTEKAAEILRKYADAYPGRHTKPTEGGIFYQSLDESMYVIPLAQAYDLIHDAGVLTEADKAHIERDLFWECAAGLIACGSRTNWGSWHLSAVGVIGLATKHQRLIDHGTTEFRRQIREELGDDGLWPESVHTYHFFPLNAFIALAEASTNAGTDLWNWEARPGKGLRAMFTAPLRYMYPDMRLPAINDGWFESFLPLDQYEAAYARFGDPELAWAVAERRRAGGGSAGSAVEDRLWSFIAGKDLPDAVARPGFPSTNFPVLGICTLRTGGPPEKEIMLTFDYGRHLGHGQMDKMGITLFARGKLLAADYGTPSYGSPVLPFYKGTSSHNTVVVDGRDQAATRKSELLAFQDAGFVKLAGARTDEAYPGTVWRRTVCLTDSYVLVVDDLESSESRTCDWLFHAEGERLELNGAARSEGGAALPYRYMDEMTTWTVAAGSADGYRAYWRMDAKDGREVPGLILISACVPGTEVLTAKCPAETAVRRVPVLIQRCRGPKARFVVALVPGEKETAADLRVSAESDGRIVVRSKEATDTFSVTDSRITVRRAPVSGKAEEARAELRPAD